MITQERAIEVIRQSRLNPLKRIQSSPFDYMTKEETEDLRQWFADYAKGFCNQFDVVLAIANGRLESVRASQSELDKRKREKLFQ